MGIKGSTTGEIFFNDMRIPADNLLGEEGEGSGSRCDSRPLGPGSARRGSGSHKGDRLRARVRQGPRDDGQADRAAPADLGHLADMETKCEAARLLYKCGR